MIAVENPVFLADGIYELRALKTRQGTVSGYFENPEALYKAAALWDGKVAGLYITLNPVNPALLARAKNRLQPHAKSTTSDSDIISRKWILIDADVVRPSDISASDHEHQMALDHIHAIQAWLTDQGWPQPVTADSGNGGHLLYRVELPNDTPSRDLVKAVLEVVALKFNDDVVTIDTSVFNAARITKAYGTLACKGDSTDERPHRRSKILNVPAEIIPVPNAALHRLAQLRPTDPKLTYHASNGSLDACDFIQRHGLLVAREKMWNQGTVYELEACPFNPEHTRSSSIIQFPTGAVAFTCFHNSCQGHHWQELRDLLEPDRQQHRATQRSQARPEGDTVASAGEVEDGLLLTAFEGVQPQSVTWAWKDRVPLGSVSGLVGNPEVGKTAIAIETAARLSRGQLEGELYGVPVSVLISSAEDSPAHTLAPRLVAAGADLAKVHLVQFRHDGMLRGVLLPDDLDSLHDQMTRVNARMLIIDPFVAHLPTQLNSWRDQDVRLVLSAVGRLAEQTQAAVLLIIHFNKGQTEHILHRVSGSVGIVAAARSVLLAAPDPTDETQYMLVHIKCNVGVHAPALRYKIEARQIAPSGIETCAIAWGGEALGVTGADVMATPNREQKTELAEAQEWLRETLAEGPQRAEAVLRDATKAGVSERTLRRAKAGLGIKVSKIGGIGNSFWTWKLPEPSGVAREDALYISRGHLHSDSLKKCNYSNNIYEDVEGGQGGQGGHLKDIERLRHTDDHLHQPGVIDLED